METTTEKIEKELDLPNINNVLDCPAFVQVHFAPPMETPLLDRVFVLKHKNRLVRLEDACRFKFSEVNSCHTFPSTGMHAHEWKQWWLLKFPKTLPDTEMCAYFYRSFDFSLVNELSKNVSSENP